MLPLPPAPPSSPLPPPHLPPPHPTLHLARTGCGTARSTSPASWPPPPTRTCARCCTCRASSACSPRTAGWGPRWLRCAQGGLPSSTACLVFGACLAALLRPCPPCSARCGRHWLRCGSGVCAVSDGQRAWAVNGLWLGSTSSILIPGVGNQLPPSEVSVDCSTNPDGLWPSLLLAVRLGRSTADCGAPTLSHPAGHCAPDASQHAHTPLRPQVKQRAPGLNGHMLSGVLQGLSSLDHTPGGQLRGERVVFFAVQSKARQVEELGEGGRFFFAVQSRR